MHINNNLQTFQLMEALSNTMLGEVLDEDRAPFFRCTVDSRGKHQAVLDTIMGMDAGFRVLLSSVGNGSLTLLSQPPTTPGGIMGAFILITSSGDQIHVDALGARPLIDRVMLAVEPHLDRTEHQQACMLTVNNGRASVTGLRFEPQPLERGNYDRAALKAFDRIVEGIKIKSPFGRLAILHGPPGTGKTNLIKGIMAATPQAKHIIVPADVLPQIAGPDFVDALIDVRGEQRLVLIVEDAMSCLVRGENNSTDVGAVLNLADGIIGSLLDIFMIATCNADSGSIDPALLRPGRLLVKHGIDALHPDDAERVFERLLGAPRATMVDRPMTLAEIYAEVSWPPSRLGLDDMGAGVTM